MTLSSVRATSTRPLVVTVAIALTACASMEPPQPAALPPTEPTPMATVAYPAPSNEADLSATALPPEPVPTEEPAPQFHVGLEVVSDRLGYFSVTVPEGWWAMSRPGRETVRLADFDLEKLDPPVTGAVFMDILVADLPPGQDIRSILTGEVELARTNPDGLEDASKMVFEDVIEAKFVGLEGVAYRAYPPEMINFAAVIDNEHYLVVRTYDTRPQGDHSPSIFDTVTVTLH